MNQSGAQKQEHVTVPSSDTSAGKQWKTRENAYQRKARENMLTVQSTEKHVTSKKRGKTGNLWKVRENIWPVQSAWKRATSDKRGKTCNQYQARKKAKSCECGKRYHKSKTLG